MQEKSFIKTEDLQNLKKTLRFIYRSRRQSLCLKRRREAAHDLLSLIDELRPFSKILSFKSFKEEIDTSLLNEALSQEKEIFLPEIEGDMMFFSRGKKRLINFDSTIILVPGIAFDKDHYRLGYGKGHYDRFLGCLPQVPTIGIGFKEQYVEILPREAHDIPLKKIALF